MMAGPPNGGKSFLALWYLLRAGCPSLYFSADTDPLTTLTRATAMLTGQKTDDIERELETEDGREHIEDLLAREVPFVKFCFDPTPTLDDIDLEIRAYEEMLGCPPEIIVVDNLMNVQAERDDEWGGLREISKALHHIARSTGAGVIALHHTSESEGRPNKPAARKAIQGKIAQLPELILTTAMEPVADRLHVACVKNRSGVHDPTGDNYVSLFTDLPRMQLFDTQQAAWASHQRASWS